MRCCPNDETTIQIMIVRPTAHRMYYSHGMCVLIVKRNYTGNDLFVVTLKSSFTRTDMLSERCCLEAQMYS